MAVVVDIVIPVLNEEKVLHDSVEFLYKHLKENFVYKFRIVIADNGSSDKTTEIASVLSQQYSEVNFTRLDLRGRGRALRKAWLESDASILSYMDVDLSTDLSSLNPLITAIAEEGFDLSVGSRLMNGSKVQKRTLKREITSRGYNLIIKSMFFTKFSDAQCGFKAISRKAANLLIPKVEDQNWFFDSELLILAEKIGLRINEIPVHWVDDPDTRVNVVKTASDDLRGLFRLRFGGLSRVLKEVKQISCS